MDALCLHDVAEMTSTSGHRRNRLNSSFSVSAVGTLQLMVISPTSTYGNSASSQGRVQSRATSRMALSAGTSLS
jgi:hypothetical protein